jgi:hypothetical protein
VAAEIAGGLEQNPGNTSLLHNLGCAEALAGRLDDALRYVTSALELKPESNQHASKDPGPRGGPEIRRLARRHVAFRTSELEELDVRIGWQRVVLSVC